MNDLFTEPEIAVFRDRQSNAETAIVALMSEGEFARARTIVGGLNAYFDYEDWRESREGFQMGLAMAGVDVKMVTVGLTPFLAWCRLTKTPASEHALEAFASTIGRFETPPEPVVLAIVDEPEFEAHSRDVAAFSAHCDYRQWSRDRRAARVEAEMSGQYVEELPISVSDFVEWSACVSQISEPSIDRYAQLLLEHFVRDRGV
jgi:hypothetical protein